LYNWPAGDEESSENTHLRFIQGVSFIVSLSMAALTEELLVLKFDVPRIYSQPAPAIQYILSHTGISKFSKFLADKGFLCYQVAVLRTR
jgi:hypothetical protein